MQGFIRLQAEAIADRSAFVMNSWITAITTYPEPVVYTYAVSYLHCFGIYISVKAQNLTSVHVSIISTGVSSLLCLVEDIVLSSSVSVWDAIVVKQELHRPIQRSYEDGPTLGSGRSVVGNRCDSPCTVYTEILDTTFLCWHLSRAVLGAAAGVSIMERCHLSKAIQPASASAGTQGQSPPQNAGSNHADRVPQQGGSFFNGQFARILKEPSGVPMQEWINEVPNQGLIHYKTVFNTERILLTSPQALGEVLVQKNYEFVKPLMMRQGLGRILGGTGILLAEGDDHKV